MNFKNSTVLYLKVICCHWFAFRVLKADYFTILIVSMLFHDESVVNAQVFAIPMIFHIPCWVNMIEKLSNLNHIPCMLNSTSGTPNIDTIYSETITNVFISLCHCSTNTYFIQKYTNNSSNMLFVKGIFWIFVINLSFWNECLEEK